MRTIKADNTEAIFSGGSGCSSDEAPVMGVERRAGAIRLPKLTTVFNGRIN